MKAHHFVLVACILGCLGACAMLKRGAWTGGGAAAGAGIGLLVGPVGAIGGAAVGAVAGQAIGENDELRSGDLIGKEAVANYTRETFVIPSWIKWTLGIVVGWTLLKWLGPRYRSLMFKAIVNFLKLRWISAADSFLKATGPKHSR